MKPLLSDKCRAPENIAIAEGNDVISDNGKLADLFDECFANVVTNLNVTLSRNILCDAEDINDPSWELLRKMRHNPVSKQ